MSIFCSNHPILNFHATQPNVAKFLFIEQLDGPGLKLNTKDLDDHLALIIRAYPDMTPSKSYFLEVI